MTWSYRTVFKDGQYSVYEVFYDEAGIPTSITEQSVAPRGETLSELLADAERYMSDIKLPALIYDESEGLKEK